MKAILRHTIKKTVSLLLAIIMVTGIFQIMATANGINTASDLLALEELREGMGAITVEAYNIGQGFLLEPSLYIKDGKSVGEITVDFLTGKGLNFTGSTSYFSGMEFDDTLSPEYPEYLEPYLGELEESGDGDGMLSEFDYSMYAGWCFTINNWWASWGASSSYPGQEITDYNTGETITLGDVIRWHFTVYGYGADCGFSSNVMAEYMGGNLFTQEDKSDLIFILAAINDYYGNLDTDDVYETALQVAANPLASTEEISEQEELLITYINNTFFNKELNPDLQYGDANNDGKIDGLDLTALKIRLLSNTDSDNFIDPNGDGVNDITDLVRLKKYIAGTINFLGK